MDVIGLEREEPLIRRRQRHEALTHIEVDGPTRRRRRHVQSLHTLGTGEADDLVRQLTTDTVTAPWLRHVEDG